MLKNIDNCINKKRLKPRTKLLGFGNYNRAVNVLTGFSQVAWCKLLDFLLCIKVICDYLLFAVKVVVIVIAAIIIAATTTTAA